MKHLPLRECGYAIVALVALCVLYGGVYLATVQRTELGAFCLLRYRFGDEQARWFFTPAHEVDRRLRPDLWDGEIRFYYQPLETTTFNPVGVMGTPVEKTP